MNSYQDHMKNTGTRTGKGQVKRETSGIPGRDDDRKLFVGGLSPQTLDEDLKMYFSKFGEIDSVTVKLDPNTGQCRGFAFIVFTYPESIDTLLASGDHYINKRKVDPKRASKNSQHYKIFVGGLTPKITDKDIKDYFSQYGTIVEIHAPCNRKTNQRKGYCFITFDSRNVVDDLLKNPMRNICDRQVEVKKIKNNLEAMKVGGRGSRRGGESRGGAWLGSHSKFNDGGFRYVSFGEDGESQGYGTGYGDGAGYSNYGNYGGSYTDYSGYGYDRAHARVGTRQLRYQPY